MDMFFLTNSSHGGGVFGFGGDESGIDIALSIKSIRTQLTNALAANNVIKFDMIGFDACLMQSYSV